MSVLLMCVWISTSVYGFIAQSSLQQSKNTPGSSQDPRGLPQNNAPSNASVFSVAAPDRLRTEHRRAGEIPCLDDPAPRFSWDVPDAGRGTVQHSFRVIVSLASEVGTRSDALINLGEELWDSGVVVSNVSVLVEYGGAPLPSHALVQWSVQVNVSAAGQPITETPWSSVSRFRTAFMNSSQVPLGSTWITTPLCEETRCLNSLRTSFTLPATKRVIAARAYSAAPGYASILVNGHSVRGADRLGPWTTWASRILYQCYDATTLLTSGGPNVIGVTLGNGQYRGPWSHAWTKVPPPLAFSFAMHVTFDDGSTTVVGSTEAGWRVSIGGVTFSDVYKGEAYNASAVQPGWDLPGFVDSQWLNATRLDPTTVPLATNFSAHAYAPIRAISSVTPVNVTRIESSGAYLVWFPTNEAGVVELVNVTGPKGATITLSHSEILKDRSGNLCLVGCWGQGTEAFYPFGGAVDHYTFSGQTTGESYQFQFTYHGFQFVQIDGWDWSPPPTIDQIRQVIVHSDNMPLGENPVFEGPDNEVTLITTIHDNVRRSLLSNMHSIESDCPTRERVGWTGDAQATAETAFRSLDIASFYSKWMQDMQDAQLPNGALSSTIPYAKHFPPVDPSWPTVYPQTVRLLYKYTGDKRIITQHIASLKRYVDYMATVKACPNCHTDTSFATQAPNGLPWFYMNGDWMEFVPQDVELADSGKILSSFHYIKDVSIVSEMASIIGDVNMSNVYGSLAQRLIEKFNSIYLSTNHSRPAPPSMMCDKEMEIKKGGKPIELSCGHGQKMTSVEAFFGTPHGSCPAGFQANPACNSANALEIVQKECIGQESCLLSPTTATFGDPCQGTVKSLAVKILGCSDNPPSPVPTPPSPLLSYGNQQVCNAAPLAEGGFVPEAVVPAVQHALLEQIVNANSHATTGFIGNKYLLQALLMANRSDLVMDLLLQTDLPSFGYQIANGATTLWENWSGGAVDSNATGTPSHNHHFMGAFGAFLWENLIGLQQGDRTAYEHFIVAPSITGDRRLSAASATTLTPRGNISVAWARGAQGQVTIDVVVPPNAQATIVTPTCPKDWIVSDHGNPLVVGSFSIRGVRHVQRTEDGKYRVVVSSGHYVLAIAAP